MQGLLGLVGRTVLIFDYGKALKPAKAVKKGARTGLLTLSVVVTEPSPEPEEKVVAIGRLGLPRPP